VQKQQLYDWIDFKKIVPIIQNFNKNREQLLSILERFHNALGLISLQGISAREVQSILLKKVITAWTENNWSIVSVENSWQELTWEICYKRNINKKELFTAIEKIKYSLPPAIQIGFEQITKSNTIANTTKQPDISQALKKQIVQKNTVAATTSGITVKNAGIVLLNNYFETLIDRLGLLQEKKFKDKDSQLDAVHYLQYVVTGLTKTEEAFLPLNKVLCGLPLATPVMESIDMTDEQKELITGLLNAAISHWPSVGDTSLLGFRGNWLVRDGLLIEKEERWELTVEKKVYDLLIHKSPFSFSIIRYPWMEKPLHVTWPY
jgi:Contractile injection system tape measure protein